MTKAIKKVSDEAMLWVFDIVQNGKQSRISIYASNRKAALKLLNEKVDEPYTILSVSVI